MSDTRENILLTALHLFAKNGYEAVSVNDIASEIGITKGALYKHYRNKRDIFDRIVERMYQLDAQRSREYDVPKEKLENDPGAYENVSLESIRNFTLSQFEFWTEDGFASDFRRMLTLEQYRSAEMAELYSGCLTAGPVSYMEDIFREMIKEGLLRESDPRQLALEFFAPFHLLVNMSDSTEDRSGLSGLLEAHIERFIMNNSMKGSEHD